MEVHCDGDLLVKNIGNAGNFILRLLGWLNPAFIRKNGVLIHPCNAVHTIGMRRPIDIVFVDNSRIVCRIVNELRPFRGALCRSACYTLELPSGMAKKYGFYEGQVVEFSD